MAARVSYAYGIKLGEDHNLRFGIAAGLFQIKLDATNAVVDDVTDEIVMGGAQSGMNFDSEFGIFYSLKGLQLGISVPQVMEIEADLQFEGIDGFTSKRHFVAYGGYDIKLNEKWNLEPSVLYKTAQTGLNLFDFNGLVTFNEMISLGAGYRTHVGMIARLGINIKDMFYSGYAYEFSGANISSYSTGSHEILLGVKFCKNKLTNDPTSSFEPNTEDSGLTNEQEEEIVEETPAPDSGTINESETEQVNINEEFAEPEVDNFKDAYQPEILFPYNSAEDYELGNNDAIKELASYLKENKNQKVIIKGHACDIGEEDNNTSVSKMRAQKVYDELTKLGVSESQLSIKAMGESEPKYPNTSDSNRKKNRRVEIVSE